MLKVEQALGKILESVKQVDGKENISIQNSLGRVSANSVLSPIDVPSHTNSAVDGYALKGIDLPAKGEAHLKIKGTAFAGKPFGGSVGSGECVKIMTGAVMPAGSDTSVKQEDVNADGEVLIVGQGHKPGQNVRKAGEDILAGQVSLDAGRLIGPAELGLLASIGIPEVTVKRRVRVAVFSTGDEIRPVGDPLGEGDIYDSNRHTIYGMLERLGVEIIDKGIIADRREEIKRLVEEGAAESDMVITSGGVSVGEADFVKEILDEIGAVDFWKIAMKPGRPLAFGAVGGTCFFGLPGNPVAVMVTFYQFVRPALQKMMGIGDFAPVRFKVACADGLRKVPGRTEFQRGVIFNGDDGVPTVRVTGKQGSGILSSMSSANCFIVLGHEQGDVSSGDLVNVEPFFGLT